MLQGDTMLHSNSESLADLLVAFSSSASAQQTADESAVSLPTVRVIGTGECTTKSELRIEAYGAIDEANSAIGLARVVTSTQPGCARVDASCRPRAVRR
jgi:hypothetical protein